MPKVSIVMPVYNQEEIVAESIQSALDQDYPDKEIIVIDDCSTDDTFGACRKFPQIKAYRNDKNAGLGGNLNECIKKSSGEFIIILCGDDIFTHPSVISDMVKVFDSNYNIGVVGRYYYQYFDGIPGAVMTIRGDILTSSCQPSGVGFRRIAMSREFTNELFIEIPFMVKSILHRGWEYEIIKYDTIAARLHSGPKSNAATQSSYYKTTPQQSPTLNWHKVLGEPIGMYMGFIQIKNRASFLLISEIKETIKLNPKCLLNLGFWFCAIIAVATPGWILRRLSNFYRHRITRKFVKIIRRPE